LFRIDDDESSSDTCENTEIITSTLDTEEVIKDAPRRSSSVNIIHTDAAPEDSVSVEAGASEEKQLFPPPELEEGEDFVVDMTEDCFISVEDAQPSLGMSQACLSKTTEFCILDGHRDTLTYLLVTWRVVSSPLCRRVADTSV
jgi:hypothetical protein